MTSSSSLDLLKNLLYAGLRVAMYIWSKASTS